MPLHVAQPVPPLTPICAPELQVGARAWAAGAIRVVAAAVATTTATETPNFLIRPIGYLFQVDVYFLMVITALADIHRGWYAI
ncbi:hypothetical protein [Streptosporangium saharense]|uniref:hypothetical protein n=1 Tax=Streptosporangium saharense TaxID=1706840 RepID=UPI003318BE24